MGNLQGSDKNKQKEGKVGKTGLMGMGKLKKSPAKEHAKHQVGSAGGGGPVNEATAAVKKAPVVRTQTQKPAEDPVCSQVSVTAPGGERGGNDRSAGAAREVETSCASNIASGSVGAVIVTDSWRQVGKLQQALDTSLPVSPSQEETSSSDSVFTDPLVTPQASDPDYTSGQECTDCRREEEVDDVTLTMETSDEESTPVSTKRRLPAPLDALDEEVEGSPSRAKSLDKLEPKTFTVVRHRKVELPPTKLSEQCLISAGKLKL